MKKVLALSIFLLFISSTFAQQFGAAVEKTQVTAISKILATPDQFMDKDLTIEGKIVSVCAKRGCWMELASDQAYQTFRIKVNDGDMVFPLDARGKKAFAKGRIKKIHLSEKQAMEYIKHQAEEQGKKFDPSAAGHSSVIYQFSPVGVFIE